MAALSAAVLSMPGAAMASPSDPAQWPTAPGANPELMATPHTVRFSGPDRYQSNLAASLALRGDGGFPFDSSDRTSANASGLAKAHDWWGPASCPRSIIVVAGDTFADALSAASLSDPADRSTQPRVQRVAAADPTFDPVGGYSRVDTAYAPIVVTTSARSGATALTPTAWLTALDLAKGGCTTARAAIIVGGRDAVPGGVESELVGLGYSQVFRVAGTDRYDTAAKVAVALGTGAGVPAGASCVDPDANDGSVRMGWYGNAVIEYRPDATHCSLRGRTVVVADGGTGADALAAGWWTSFWQVPVLLTAPDGTLPPATRTALQSLPIDTVVVLGGTARIPETPTIDDIKALTHAGVGRFAGADRYATSIDTAEKFGGWWPTGHGRDFAGDMVCLAASSGSGVTAVGWPDALSAGPWCARAGATGRGSPRRALSPVTGVAARTGRVGGARPDHDAMPILLVPNGGALAASTQSFLASTFVPGDGWCTADRAPMGCLSPGFATLFGGTQAIPAGTERSIAALVDGGNEVGTGDQAPSLQGGFATRLDLTPAFAQGTTISGIYVCHGPSTLADVRWLSVTGDPARRSFVSEADVLAAGVYGTPDASAPVCVSLGSLPAVTVAGVSVSGHVSGTETYDLGASGYVLVPTPLSQDGQSHVGPGGSTWSFGGPPPAGVTLQTGDTRAAIDDANLDLSLAPATSGTTVARGTAHLVTATGVVTGTILATAQVASGGWRVRGSIDVTLPGLGARRGGFTADLSASDPAHGVWSFDGYPSPR